MKTVIRSSLILLFVIVASSVAFADLLSESYQFQPGIELSVGRSTQSGLRVDSVRFSMPSSAGGRYVPTAGQLKAEVAISNIAEESGKVGIAIALFDAEGRMLAAATGGSKLVAIKAGRQKVYTLVFEHVNNDAHRAKDFRISVESKP